MRVRQRVRLVRRSTPEHARVLRQCRSPLARGTEIVFRGEDGAILAKAKAEDVSAYVALLLRAGRECAKLDATKYERDLPQIICDDVGFVQSKL